MPGFIEPCCESCLARHAGVEGVQIRFPVTERCVYCGEHTAAGLYVRIDPNEVLSVSSPEQ